MIGILDFTRSLSAAVSTSFTWLVALEKLHLERAQIVLDIILRFIFLEDRKRCLIEGKHGATLATVLEAILDIH